MVDKKFGILIKIILLLIILIPITFRVYDLYYSNISWDINSKYISRGKAYRIYNKEKSLYGVPNVYYKYKDLSPEEMMSLDVLANNKGYDIDEVIPNVEKFVLYKDGKKINSTLTTSEKSEVNNYMNQIKLSVENTIRKNNNYVFSMKIILSILTALMIVLSIYAVLMMFKFINEK